MQYSDVNWKVPKEVTRWIDLKKLITLYNPQARVKRSIIQSHDPEPDNWTNTVFGYLDVLNKINKKEMSQIVSLVTECGDIIVGNYSAESKSNPELLCNLDDHIRRLWKVYIPRINPTFTTVPFELQINLLLELILTAPENRHIIKQVIERALFCNES